MTETTEKLQLHRHLHRITIGSRLLLTVIMVLSVSFKTTKAQAQAVLDIGSVEEVSGYAQIKRDGTFEVTQNFNIQSYDQAQTEAGRMGIRFIDDTTIKITEHSQVIIDEFVFDPNPDNSKLAVSFVKGTARFTSGLLGKINKKNMVVKTNSAVVGIRGTDFTVTVEADTGESLFILLPNPDGTASGEIVVSTLFGEVVLNQPYQATTTTTFESPPSKPVILDLTLEFIDNMLIVNPPRKVKEEEEAIDSRQGDILDFDELEYDALAEDELENRELEFTELDYDALNVNFLEDLLDIINELDRVEEEEELNRVATSVDVKGTNVGQDTSTQITTVVSGQTISMKREVSDNANIVIDSNSSYTVILEQDGIMNEVKVNGGSSSTIVIRQGSG
tara:strand:+ start:44 stop:1216 length:1173 start_codon:yes stop_codon:yes gene_type:complete